MSILQSFLIHKKNRVIMFDIDNASIGASVVEREHDDIRTILFSIREPINFSRFPDDTVAALSDAIQRAGARIAQSPAVAKTNLEIHALVHAPWSTSSSHKLHSELSHETTITQKILDTFIERKTKDALPKEYIETDRNITNVQLNGYTTEKPIGKRAKTITVSMLTSMMPKRVHTSVLKALQKTLPNHTVVFDAFIFGIVRNSARANQTKSFSYLDVGGEHTSFICIENGAIRSVAQIEFGALYPLRAINKELAGTPESARSLLTLYNTNTCTPSQCRKISTALESAEQEWIKKFGDACVAITKEGRMPKELFITCEARVLPWIQNISEKIDFAQFTASTQPFVGTNLPANTTDVRTADDVYADQRTLLCATLLKE